MAQVILPKLDQFKLTLETARWYILNDPTPRLILAIGYLPALTKMKGVYWIYDPAKHRFETIDDTSQLAWEVDVEIKGL